MPSSPARPLEPSPAAPFAASGLEPGEVPDGGRAAPGLGRRTRAARGVIVNGAFLAAVNALGVVKGILLAALLTAAEYGVWGLLTVTFATLLWLAGVGLDDKYIQQDHPDQEEAFQIAFTLHSLLCAAFMGLVVLTVPLFALAYGQHEIVWPGIALAATWPAIALQMPLWAYYRRMEFGRQRRLQAWDPIVSFLATIALVAAGLGVWGVVLGTIAGGWAAAIAAVRASPYPLRFRRPGGALREYAAFSWPLFLGSATGVLAGLVPMLVASRESGLAAVGAITLAATIATFANRVDEVVTQTLYPAICAVKDRADLLFETFAKSNRLALLWAAPCGAAAVLFAGDFVDFVIGDKWTFAVLLIQVLGAAAALNQIGFNWTAFYRARGETRPIAVVNVVMLAAVLAIAVPLVATGGVDGYAIGMAAAMAIALAVRVVYLLRLFPALGMAAHVARGLAPTLPAVVAVLAVRMAGGDRTPGRAVAEGLLFCAVVAASALLAERALLRESLAYLAPGRAARVSAR
jgi:O-antigen/teichoic acid export membrane protein